MRAVIFLIMVFFAQLCLAQTEEKTVTVGQYVLVKPCKKGSKEFVSMDVYARTKPYNKSKVDSLTGDGLIQEFFNDKSIDAKRLPCVMGGYKYKIAAYHEFEEKGAVRRVLYNVSHS